MAMPVNRISQLVRGEARSAGKVRVAGTAACLPSLGEFAIGFGIGVRQTSALLGRTSAIVCGARLARRAGRVAGTLKKGARHDLLNGGGDPLVGRRFAFGCGDDSVQ